MATLRTETYPTTIGYLVKNFAGRKDWINYDPTKLIHIHKRNRAFVWITEMVEKLLDTIIKGYVILPLVCCSVICDGVERREIMDGGNRLTAFALILNDKVRVLTPEEKVIVLSFPITLIIMYNMSSQQIREQFRRLNTCKRATSGQLYQMSQDDSTLIQEAIAFMTDVNYPLRERCIKVFTDFYTKEDTDSAKRLENVVGIISGTLYGVRFITTSFDKQEQHVENKAPIDRNLLCKHFDIVLKIFEIANDTLPLDKKKEKKEQFTLGNLIGAILYDIHQKYEESDIIYKWSNYILQVRQRIENAKEACELKGAQNLNPDKLAKKSYRVQMFLQERRLVSEDELKNIKHKSSLSEDEDEDEEEEDSTDENV
jgi:hypothetical protein